MKKCFDWEEDLLPYARQNREIFARYGLTMYFSQCLEQKICLMLSTMYNEEFLRVPPAEREQFFEKNITKTLGRMERDLKDVACLPMELEDRLRAAVRLRNWLAHRYFYDRDKDILDVEGREKMIQELQDKADILKELDNEFTNSLKRWMHDKGISEGEIQKEIQNYLSSDDIEYC